jgi:two-component sensor histidine kinase
LREKTVLLNEVHHRVKNNLQVISSLLNLQAAHSGSAEAHAVLAESQRRVRAMALIHELLYERKDYSHVHLGSYCERLGRLLVQSLEGAGSDITLRLEGTSAEIYLDLQRAIPCGLVVNELVTNAVKHAFSDGRSGEICIALHESASGEASVVVSDTGVGLPDGFDPANAKSLGFQLLPLLVDQIQGTLTIGEGPGTRFEIRFAADRAPSGATPR